MQGIAGAIDRFGQAFGPVVGGAALHILGEAALMWYTGIGLALISSICLLFMGDGCVSWSRISCVRTVGGGYTLLGQSHTEEIEMAEEVEIAESLEKDPASLIVAASNDRNSDSQTSGLAKGASYLSQPLAPVAA